MRVTFPLEETRQSMTMMIFQTLAMVEVLYQDLHHRYILVLGSKDHLDLLSCIVLSCLTYVFLENMQIKPKLIEIHLKMYFSETTWWAIQAQMSDAGISEQCRHRWAIQVQVSDAGIGERYRCRWARISVFWTSEKLLNNIICGIQTWFIYSCIAHLCLHRSPAPVSLTYACIAHLPIIFLAFM
jgi:hypothetical protein